MPTRSLHPCSSRSSGPAAAPGTQSQTGFFQDEAVLLWALIRTAGAWEKRKQTNLNTDSSFLRTLTATPAQEVGVPTALVQ